MRAVAAAILLTLASQQQPPRDAAPAAAAPAGTAVIRGRVVSPGTKTPIPGALVTLGGTSASPRPPRTIYTDASGRFEFKDLPAGIYAINGRPAHYQMQFLDGPRSEIPLADGQVVEGVELPLARAGAIVGRLVDEFGQPIGGMGVTAIKLGSPPGTSASSAATDELGRYRVFHLAPGGYVVVTRSSGLYDFNTPTTLAFVETYFPGTPSRSDAVRIDVRAGEDTEAGDLRVLRGRTLRVRGIVVDSQGRPAQANRTTVSLSRENSGTSRSVDPQGRFDFLQPNPPGSYRLAATMRTEGGQAVEEYVAQSLTLTDADVDVILTTRPAASVTGRIVIDEPTQANLSALSVRARNGSGFGGEIWIEPAPVTKDLTFTFPRLAGEQLLRIEGFGSGRLTLQAVLRGDEDVTDIPTEFKPDDQIRIILSSHVSGVQGTVTTDGGKPVSGYAVLVFSEDRKTWVQGSTRVVSNSRTDRVGHYGARVPPGRYYVIAVPLDRSMPSDRVDAMALESLVKEATTVVVSPDEIRVVDLQVAPGGGH